MSEAVELMRSPIDTNCGDCKGEINFGQWCYYEPATGNALCVDCSVQRGWSPKQRVDQLIKKLELQEDVKALTKQWQIETEALLLIRREMDVREIDKKDKELEGQIIKLMASVDSYLKSCGDKGEEKALKNVFDEIRRAQDLQREVREIIRNRLFLLERRKRKMKQVPVPEES